jgi:hypothetical protein
MIPKFPTIANKPVTIHPDTGRAVVAFSHGSSKKAAVITSKTRDVTVSNIDAKLSSRSVLFQGLPGSVDNELIGCRLITGGSLVDCGLGGVRNLVIQDCGCDVPTTTFGLFYFGGKRGIDPVHENIRLIKCWSAGSIHEHILRAHNVNGLFVTECDLQNPQHAPWQKKNGACLNLRDVKHVSVEGSRGSGQFPIGPLADKDGGINLPIGPERDRMLGLRCEDVLVDDFEFAGYIIIEAGTRNITLRNMRGRLDGSNTLITLEKAYGPREIPREITVENCHFTGPKSARFLSGKATKLVVRNCTFNGKKV